MAARAALEQAVRLQPENARTWLRLAELELYVLDRPAVALDAVRPALFLDPRDAETIDTFVNARRAAAEAEEVAQRGGWIRSPRASISTNFAIRRARVSGRLASWTRYRIA